MSLYKVKREELKDLQRELANSERSLMAKRGKLKDAIHPSSRNQTRIRKEIYRRARSKEKARKTFVYNLVAGA
jgi:hypothetical protein